MSELTPTTFDYSDIEKDDKSKLVWLAGEVNRKKASGLIEMLEMGKAIGDAHDILANHKGGTFGAWVEAECGISKRSAYNYMLAAKRFKGCASLAQLKQYTAEAIYTLSADSAPPEAIKKAEKLVEKGVKITEKVAKSLLKKKPAKPKAEPQPEPSDTKDEPPPAPVRVAETPVHRAWGEGDSLEAVQDDLKEFNRRLRELSKFGRTILRCEGDEITRPYCGNYSLLTLSHPILHVARCVMNDMPVGGTPKKPLLFHEEKAKSLA